MSLKKLFVPKVTKFTLVPNLTTHTTLGLLIKSECEKFIGYTKINIYSKRGFLCYNNANLKHWLL